MLIFFEIPVYRVFICLPTVRVVYSNSSLNEDDRNAYNDIAGKHAWV